MSEREHDRWREELSAYLLGALDPAEAAKLERHLAGCEECRAELAWLRPAAGLLPESVEQAEAPPELRARIMAEVSGEVVGERSRQGRRSFFRGLDRREPRRRPMPLRAAAGLAALVLIAAGFAAYAIESGDAGKDATTVVVGEETGVTARMVREGNSGTLRLANLRRISPDEALQAWVRRGDRVDAAGAPFVPDRDGTAIATIDDMRDVDAVMVTVEPRAGSDLPTSDPLISIPLSQ